MRDRILQIAMTCHAAHRAFCLGMGQATQPEWDKVSIKHKDVVYTSIRGILNGSLRSVEHSHMKFVEEKKARDWIYGELYSIENKTNPRLVDYEDLNQIEQIKEAIFFEIVRSFM